MSGWQTLPMAAQQPPIIFSLLGVAVGVGVAWLITGESVMALVFLVVGVLVVLGLRFAESRRRG